MALNLTYSFVRYSISLSIYFSIYLFLYLSVSLSICFSIYLSVWLSGCLSVCCLSDYPVESESKLISACLSLQNSLSLSSGFGIRRNRRRPSAGQGFYVLLMPPWHIRQRRRWSLKFLTQMVELWWFPGMGVPQVMEGFQWKIRN